MGLGLGSRVELVLGADDGLPAAGVKQRQGSEAGSAQGLGAGAAEAAEDSDDVNRQPVAFSAS